MNILYINHYAGSIYHGMEYRPYYLSREWVKLGHNVTIIAADYSHLRTNNPILNNKDSYQYETIDGVNYIWCKTPKYPENGIKRVINIFSFLSKLKRLIPTLLTTNRPDLVIASSTYPLDTKIAYKIAKMSKSRFVYEVHDLWPLTPIELGGMSKYHPFIYLMQRFENFAYRHADKVVSLLPMASDYMVAHGMKPDKFMYIPNGIDINDVENNKESLDDRFLAKLQSIKIKYKLLIGYAGGMGESNALSYLIEAAKDRKLSDIAFVLVGDGVLKQSILDRVILENISNVFVLPRINKNQVPNFLAQMDALYIGWHKLSIYRFGICPNKLFDYMLAKRPIIHSVSAGNDLVDDAQCGISVLAEDVEGIKQAILRLSELPESELSKMGTNANSYVRKYHDYRTLAKNFLSSVEINSV